MTRMVGPLPLVRSLVLPMEVWSQSPIGIYMTKGPNARIGLAGHLGAVVRQARKQAELTQADVADRVGVVTEVFGRLERGQLIPSVPHLRKLCRALHLDANLILGLDAERTPVLREDVEPDAEDPPELRRLVRLLRRMDAGQLAVVSVTAQAVSKHLGPQSDDPDE